MMNALGTPVAGGAHIEASSERIEKCTYRTVRASAIANSRQQFGELQKKVGRLTYIRKTIRDIASSRIFVLSRSAHKKQDYFVVHILLLSLPLNAQNDMFLGTGENL